MNRLGFIALALLLLPQVAVAGLSVTEVAWMGTESSSNDEWIELFNNGTETVPLSTYTLSWGSEASPKTILLEGSVALNGYFLLERTNDESVPSVLADQIYVGALSNTGEKLTLKQNGDTVFTLDALSGWPGGDNTSKNTLQWSGSGWITAPSTPKAPNATLGVSTTTETTEPSLPEDDNQDEEITNSTSPSSHSSPAPLSSATYQSALRVSAGRDRLGVPGEPILFEAYLFDRSGNRLPGAALTRWSFGDGTESQGEKIWHTYYSPGTYTIFLTATRGNDEAVSRAKILIVNPEMEIQKGEGRVEITNKSMYEINLGGWKIFSNDTFFTLAKDTILPSEETLSLPGSITKFPDTDNMFSLHSPSDTFLFEPLINNVETISEISTSTKIQELQSLLNEKKKELALYTGEIKKEENKFSSIAGAVAMGFKEDGQKVASSTEAKETTALVLNADRGIFEKILSAPARAWRVLKERIF